MHPGIPGLIVPLMDHWRQIVPQIPYYAVIFTSTRSGGDDGYDKTAARMLELAARQDGFLGVDKAPGITVSYWQSKEAIAEWRNHAEHRPVRAMGRAKWYASYKLRVCRVEREVNFKREE